MDAERNLLRRALMREVNDRILEVNDQFESMEPVGIICECVRAGCIETITIDRPAYDEIRQRHARYVLVVGHQEAEDELVGEHERYVVAQVTTEEPGL